MRDKRAKLTKAQLANSKRAVLWEVGYLLSNFAAWGVSPPIDRHIDKAGGRECERLLRVAIAAVRADRGPRR